MYVPVTGAWSSGWPGLSSLLHRLLGLTTRDRGWLTGSLESWLHCCLFDSTIRAQKGLQYDFDMLLNGSLINLLYRGVINSQGPIAVMAFSNVVLSCCCWVHSLLWHISSWTRVPCHVLYMAFSHWHHVTHSSIPAGESEEGQIYLLQFMLMLFLFVVLWHKLWKAWWLIPFYFLPS